MTIDQWLPLPAVDALLSQSSSKSYTRSIYRHNSCLFSDLKHEHNEVLDLSTSQTRDRNTNTKTKSRKRNKRKKVKLQRGSSQLDKKSNHKSGSVTEDEIAHHVSSMYVNGPGGYLKEASMKREKQSSSFDDKEYLKFLQKLDRHPALVLNADYQALSVLPLSIWSWQETMKAVFSGKVVVVDVYPGITVKAVNVDVPLPSVIALTEYAKQPSQSPAFTRRNVFLRDGYICQYCSETFMTRDLSLDHVTPRCMGGQLNWENAVTSCRKCNGRKGHILPSDLKRIGMRLKREPRVPTKWELAANAEKMVPKKVHSTWKPFLGMHMIPEEERDEERAFFDDIEESF